MKKLLENETLPLTLQAVLVAFQSGSVLEFLPRKTAAGHWLDLADGCNWSR